MKHLLKRLLPMVLVLTVCVGLLSSLSFSASAATVNYVYKGKYIYNWGTRGTLATFLSPNAEDFYEDNGVTYDELASYSGSSSISSVPSSALYKKLQTLMKNAQTHETSYQETRYQYCYTDCENSGSPKTISSFYSGAAIGPEWDSGKTWNREHVWPNSKGDASGNGENDIMMLRPTSVSENSSRGNKAFGKSSSYFNPNSKNSKYDLRGDVARICLYVYVRWGNTGNMWGSSGVIESKAVLLEWMEADPVDTWELGRNDSVEAITGTRNVFVDYPELAFLLFGADIPADYDSPSSGGSGNAPVNTTTTTTTTRNNNTTTTTTTTTTRNNNTTTTTTGRNDDSVTTTTTTTVNNPATTTTTTGRNDDSVTTTTTTTGHNDDSVTTTTTTSATNASTEPDESDVPYHIIAVAAGVFILLGAAIWYFGFYRKRKQVKIEE